jgi:predicted PurR-regulated permease PerM
MSVIIDAPVALLKKTGIKNEDNAKLIVYGVITVLSVVVVWVAYRKIKNLLSSDPTGGQAAMQQSVDSITVNTLSLTIDQDTATLIANNLLDAMNRIGVDSQAIIDNLNKCQTQADLQLVIKTFGVKPFDGFLATTWIGIHLLSVPKDLAGWIRGKDSISSDDLATIQGIFENLNVPF